MKKILIISLLLIFAFTVSAVPVFNAEEETAPPVEKKASNPIGGILTWFAVGGASTCCLAGGSSLLVTSLTNLPFNIFLATGTACCLFNTAGGLIFGKSMTDRLLNAVSALGGSFIIYSVFLILIFTNVWTA